MRTSLYIYVQLLSSLYIFIVAELNVHKIVCSLPKDFHKVDDVEIISPKDLLNDFMPRKFFFLFVADVDSATSIKFFQKNFSAIPSSKMPNLIFLVEEFYYVNIVASMVSLLNKNALPYYQSHKAELMHLFDSLADKISKQTLFHYIKAYMFNSVYKGEHIPTRWKYFFGCKYEYLYKHLDGECWINCGANCGDTIFQYLSFNFKPKKIYAFESDTKNYKHLLNNLSLLPPEKCKLIEPINEFIDETTDFKKILKGNKCTLLNADIEGAELPLLRAMKDIIQADRPVMAICVYHLREDLLLIPQFIQSILEDYLLYLPKYAP